jgi:hypothetical protein
LEEINLVINRVAKGIRYLYQISHPHSCLSNQSVTWPVHRNDSIQLIDEWALPDNARGRVNNSYAKTDFAARDFIYVDGLYRLGMIAQGMFNFSSKEQNKNNSLYEELRRKIYILLSDNIHERLEIYNTFPSQNGELENEKTMGDDIKPRVEDI